MQFGIMSVDVKTDGDTFEASAPKLLFSTQMALTSGAGNNGIPFAIYDISPDGQRFLITRPPPNDEREALDAITVVLDWQSALSARERA